MEGKTELMFIPLPGVGHLVSAVELGKLLISRDEHFSVVFLIIQLSFDAGVDAFIESQSTDSGSRIRFVKIPPHKNPPPSSQAPTKSKIRAVVAFEMINSFKPLVRDVILEMKSKPNSRKIAGVVVDMFCSGMIDVVNELELPSYVFYASGAGYLGLNIHVQTLFDDHNQDVADLKTESDAEIVVPSFMNPVPVKVLPSLMLDKNGGSNTVFEVARKMRETKGIIVNTFLELESYAIKSLSGQGGKDIPPIYPIGPMISWKFTPDDGITNWLDTQPSGSVLFLCFGTFGTFGWDQVKEIAKALERSGCRFLWSLRQPPAKGSIAAASTYENFDEILPEGFLERTSGVGKVIGWAPQNAVLSHPAVGGFVSHCGWNSVLESLWAGVPLAAWPLYAEQQVNAFEMVVELGLGVEIKMDYRHDANMESQIIVSADEIERGIKRILMEKNEIGEKVKHVSEICRKAVLDEDGSSQIWLGKLVQDIKNNIML